MSTRLEPVKKKRLLSLDVLRGITVAGMILVNNAGGPFTYAPLQHAEWNGLTPCDLVFPFFLFIMGISTYIALYKFDFKPSSQVLYKIVKRTVLILLIGWGIDWFHCICKGDFLPFDHLRLTGVFPRIALCYGIVSLIAIYINHKHLLKLSALLLIGYTLILLLGNGYLCDESNVLGIVDRALLGSSHLYQKSPIDPEGFTSTLSAIAHTLIGFYCGQIIFRTKDIDQKVLQLFLIGFILLSIGWLFSFGLPLNKRVWSPTFACLTCGGASSLLAMLMFLIDIKGKERWGKFFVIFGVNPLFLYVLSEMLAILFGVFGVKRMLYDGIHLWVTDPYLASATYAILFTLLLGAFGYPLYKRKIYIKI